MGDGLARTEEEAGPQGTGQRDHLHVSLLHPTLHTVVCTESGESA